MIRIQMSEIRTTKIDGVEFVTLTDYLRLKEENKDLNKENSELEKELVYKPIYLPVRFFKKEAYIHIDDYKEAINKRENVVNGLEEENKKLKEKLEQIKETYIKFEDSEKEYNKGLGELDQLIMNR